MRWRKRIGEEDVEWLLTKTIEAGRKSGVVEKQALDAVAVDTTVMEKAIAHPTDSRLYERARARLVDLAHQAGVTLRQSYARVAPRLVVGLPLKKAAIPEPVTDDDLDDLDGFIR